jgi:hypothetical protein
VIAVDGRAVCGAKDNDGKAPNLSHGIGAVLGQVAVAAKTNEIPVRDLLSIFADLADTEITARNTRLARAQALTTRGSPNRGPASRPLRHHGRRRPKTPCRNIRRGYRISPEHRCRHAPPRRIHLGRPRTTLGRT